MRSETHELNTIRQRAEWIEGHWGHDWCRANPIAFAKLYAAYVTIDALKGAPRRPVARRMGRGRA